MPALMDDTLFSIATNMKIPAAVLLLYACLPLMHGAKAQSLSFTQPVNLLPSVKTDRAIDITNFKKHYFITWKEAGNTGNVRVCYLGKQYDTVFAPHVYALSNQSTAYAPVLRVLGNRIYLFWIAADGSLKYIFNHSDTSFDTEHVYTVPLNGNPKLASGITTTAVNGKLLIASHSTNKDKMVYALAETGADGQVQPANLVTVPGKSSADYPFVVTLSDSLVRLAWRDYKKQDVYCADLNIYTGQWTDQQPVAAGRSGVSPALYHVGNSSRLFYIWKGLKSDNRLYYATAEKEQPVTGSSTLPPYFSTTCAASICTMDEENFMLSFVGEDQKIYLSYFFNYNPASWMGDLLMGTKSNYTLKDIVIPGSHDAGMSVLNGVGGIQVNSVNECNTLTQTQNIGAQLDAGIRMFDLRVGTYKNELYTKHCSSDCMAEAMGGGYGEKLADILGALKTFLQKNNRETVLLSFSHFCEKETPTGNLIDTIVQSLGEKLVYRNNRIPLNEVPLQQLAGKVVLAFEGYSGEDKNILPCTMQPASGALLNFRREYAATNDINKLTSRQEAFFNLLKQTAARNDLVRLDWQLTQSSDEAAMVCNDFQSDKTSPLINSAMLLTSIIKKHQRITDLATNGNKYLASKLNQWISDGTINRSNKPNILYVDVAGNWITDYCIDLNKHALYNK